MQRTVWTWMVSSIFFVVGSGFAAASECTLNFTSPDDGAVVDSPNVTVYGQGGASAELGNTGTVTTELNGSAIFNRTGTFTTAMTFFRTRGVSITLEPGANHLSVSGSVGGCSASDNMTLYYEPESEPESAVDWDSGQVSCNVNGEGDNQCPTVVLDEVHTRCDDADGVSTEVGNPIDCATGQKIQTEIDYPGAGPDPLVHQRTYTSPAEDEDNTTRLWASRMPHAEHLELEDGAELLILTQGRHLRRALFKPADGEWESNPRLPSISVDVSASGGYTLSLDDGRSFHLNSDYQVESVAQKQRGTDPVYEYEYADVLGTQRLQRQINRFGRSLEYDYDTDGNLISLIDQDGHRIDYEYDNEGNLVRVLYPSTAAGGERPQRQYLYELDDFPQHLTGIIDERGHRFATFSYDDTGRAVATEHHDGADRTTVSYPEDNAANVRYFRDTQSDQYREEHFAYGRFRGAYRLTQREVTHCDGCQIGAEHWHFNAQGLLEEHIDFNGHRHTWEYDQQGRKTRHTEAVDTPEERTTLFTWVGDMERLHTEQQGNQLRTLEYDDQGRVVSETVTAASSVADESRTTRYTYNANGQVLTEIGPRTDVSALTEYEYDSATGNLLSVTNALGHVTRYEDHTGAGLPQRIVDPNGLVTEVSYDWEGRVVEQTIAAANGDLTTAYMYDAAGLLAEVHTPDGQHLNYQYDNAQRLVGLSNAQGDSITYDLDSAGNIISTRIHDIHHKLVHQQQQVYDNLNRLREHMGGTDQQTTSLDYDNNSNLTGATDPEHNPSTEHQFDALNRIKTLVDSAYGETRFQYNEQGQISAVTDAEGLTTRYEYDAFGNLVTQISPDTGTTHFEYDAADNLISRTDDLGNITEYRYDALNRLIQQIYPQDPSRNILLAYDSTDNGNSGLSRLTAVSFAGGHVHYRYNDLGQAIRKERAIGEQIYTTQYRYNHLSQLSELSYPSGLILGHEYNDQGQLTALRTRAQASGPWQTVVKDLEYLPFGPVQSLTFGNGITEQRQHDLDYRLASIQSDVQDTAYQFDLNSNIAQIQDGQNSQASRYYAYDSLNRLIDADHADGQQQFSYDGIGNRLTYADEDTTEHYQYDSNSHWLQSRADIDYRYDDVGNLLGNDRHRFTYNADGHLASVNDRVTDDLVAEYDYNPWRQPIRKTTGDATPDYLALAEDQETIADEERQRADDLQQDVDDLAQNATAAQEQSDHLQQQAEQSTQQATDRETQALNLQQQADTAQAQADNWQARADGYRNERQQPPSDIWQRIKNTGLEALAWAAQTAADIHESWTEQRQEQAQLAMEEADTLWDQATSDQANASEQQQLADDYAAQRDDLQTIIDESLMLAEEASAQAEHYRVLAESNPSSGGATTDYVYLSDGQLLGEYGAGNTNQATEYIYLRGTPIAMVQNEQLYFIHSDHLGTAHTLTDNNQDIVWHARHDPFGHARIQTEQVTFNLRFPGQYCDAETELHYNWHRYYDPAIGRYITSDPIGLDGGLSTYAYVNGNPLRSVDPMGLVKWTGNVTAIAGIPGVGATHFKYELSTADPETGEIIDVTVIAGGPAAGIGVRLSAGQSQQIRFVDDNEIPDPLVFGGQAIYGSASWALGMMGFSVSYTTLGDANSEGVFSYQVGYDASIYTGIGMSTVTQIDRYFECTD